MPLIDNINNNNNNNNNHHYRYTSSPDETENSECIHVTLTRSPLHGFGIAIGGGNNTEFKRHHHHHQYDENQSDQQSLIVCEVIKNGPADGKLLPNDEIINVNGHPVIRSMENTALKLIRESTDFVNLVIRRRKTPVVVSDSQPPIKFVLNKTRKDEKFGLVLGCRYFIKRIHLNNNSEMLNDLHEGDEILKINETPVDRLTLQEAQKLIDKAKERLVLFVIPNQMKIDKSPSSSSLNPMKTRSKSLKKELQSDYNPYHFDRPATTTTTTTTTTPMINPSRSFSNGTRFVSFLTDSTSMGIRLAGGDKHGLFICEVQPHSVAHQAGLMVADKIFSVNNIDFANFTREEAVLCLMNMKTTQVNMIVANLRHEYEQLLADVGGDSFYIRAHFTYNTTNDEELSIRVNDIFHVTDTLYNGQVGQWVATKLNAPTSMKTITGAIPNKSKAEQLASVAPTLEQLTKPKQPSFKRKLRSKFSDKRSRSVTSLNHLKEDSPLTSHNSKFPAYERVVLKSVSMVRPIVLFGPLADIARDRLLKEYPDRFEIPRIETHSPTKARANVIKLQSIKNVIQRNRHCLLDVTPTAVEQLNYAQCYPIVIFFKATDRRQIKEIRQEYGKLYQKSSRRLFESAERLEFLYSYLFTSSIKIDSTTTNWYKNLKSQIEFQQEQPIWMSDDRPADKDLPNSDEYFISTRHSYSDDQVTRDESSPDSERISLSTKKNSNYLQRVASDPVVYPKDKSRSFSDEEDEDEDEDDDRSGLMQHSIVSLPNRSHSVIEIPTTTSNIDPQTRRSTVQLNPNSLLYQRSMSHLKSLNEENRESMINTEQFFRPEKPNLDLNSSVGRRSYASSSIGRAESLNQIERDDLYRLQRLYQYEGEEENFKTRFENEQIKATRITSPSMHVTNTESKSSRRPLIAPKLRNSTNQQDRLSSSDSGTSLPNQNGKSSQNVYATWNKPMTNRPTVLPAYSNGNDLTENLLKQKMSSSKKHQHTMDNPRSQSFSSSPQTTTMTTNRFVQNGENPLQKPRVYTYEDRSFLHQQNLLSSSSTSSSLSVKDKSMKEMHDTRSNPVRDQHHLIGGARGLMDFYGGKLACPKTGVSISVPVGAIPDGVQLELFFNVFQDTSNISRQNAKQGQRLSSPIVACGPVGFQFLKPVELIIPHDAGNEVEKLALMLHGANQNGTLNYSSDKSTVVNGINKVTNAHISVLVDHF